MATDTELILPPRAGDHTACRHCGGRINYSGSNWLHDAGIQEHPAEPPPLTPFGQTVRLMEVAADLMPFILDHLRKRLPAEARAMAEEAAAAPGLDELSLFALADWLEENRLPVTAGKVRRLPLKDGDLLVMQPDVSLSPESLAALRESFKRTEDRLAAAGRRVVTVVIPHGVSLTNLTRRS